MISRMLYVTIFVLLVVWFLLPRVARIMIHTPTAISIFVCLSMVQLIYFFQAEDCIRYLYVTGVQTCALPISTVPGTGVTGNLRPDVTGAPLDAAPSGLFLNPAAFRIPPQGQWGNAGRNSITGPSQFSLKIGRASCRERV